MEDPIRKDPILSHSPAAFARPAPTPISVADEDGPGDSSRMKIRIVKDGPYVVAGGVPLSRQTIVADSQGESIEWVPQESLFAGESYVLCRCGRSSNKPFCDGTHLEIGFVGEETADRQPYADMARELDGPVLALTDAEPLCASARFCDRAGGVWNSIFQADTGPAREAFTRQVGQCPSGRLAAWDLATHDPIEPVLTMGIVLVEDPHEDVSGPIWVRGGIEITSSDGIPYEVRNRVTLCRCGQSKNKPFCDGTHASIGFSDA